MKATLKRLGIFAVLVCLLIWLAPRLLNRDPASPAAAKPLFSSASPSPSPTALPISGGIGTGGFCVWDISTETLYTLNAADFLRGALLCEMSPSAPTEALKAQAVATLTLYTWLKAKNPNAEYDFVCDSANWVVYTSDADAAERFGSEWDSVCGTVDNAVAAVDCELLLYEDEPIESLYTAISSGCTRPLEEIADSGAPYLEAVACPFDMLYDGYQMRVVLSPDAVRTSFPSAALSGKPEEWFSSPALSDAGYVERIEIGGTAYSGNEVREKLGLRSAAFSVDYDESEGFTITTRGWGNGVGMSQAGAIYLAQNGWDYKQILKYFYPGTVLQKSSPE